MRHAVTAQQAGWHIFPCRPGEKTPLLEWADAATNDLRTITTWWARHPRANIGVACKPSGLLVVDCDMPKPSYVAAVLAGLPREKWSLHNTPYAHLHDQYGPLVDGTDCLRAMCHRYGQSYESLLDTYQVTTTRMGLHLYYRWPAGVPASQASPIKGHVDVRNGGGTRGGYVLAAGSATPAGAYVADNQRPVADAPPWLVELVRAKPQPVRAPRTPRMAGAGQFAGLVATVAAAGEGSRATTLHWAACRMRDDGASEADALAELVPPAVAAGLPEREARGIVQRTHLPTRRTP
ncbi:bifunctional DNA primase/polymerase [Streptomyces sp. 796.1]|uniref:bifunctional DNA primase/polymerase n=1 Tax=Streptomyces sp. 796.1 TaxID=3163029 RepID=UPI0039C98D3F